MFLSTNIRYYCVSVCVCDTLLRCHCFDQRLCAAETGRDASDIRECFLELFMSFQCDHKQAEVVSCSEQLIACGQVADVQANVKAAQQVLTDVRKVFAEKAEAAKAAKGEGAPKAKAGAKRAAKAKAAP